MQTSFHHQPEAQHPKSPAIETPAGRLPHLWVISGQKIRGQSRLLSVVTPIADKISALWKLMQTGPPLKPRSATMQDNAIFELPAPKHMPWNKGKLTGAKPPLRQKHVWAIRTKLQIDKRTRDLALFNLAIDSKLRGCDVVALKVEDVAPNGYCADRATVRQKKTGRPVRF